MTGYTVPIFDMIKAVLPKAASFPTFFTKARTSRVWAGKNKSWNLVDLTDRDSSDFNGVENGVDSQPEAATYCTHPHFVEAQDAGSIVLPSLHIFFSCNNKDEMVSGTTHLSVQAKKRSTVHCELIH